jgi:uncharacterized small protein (DUF1192 family)
VLPSSLSAQERQQWHQLSSAEGLFSTSRGIGDSRRCYITTIRPGPVTGQSGQWLQKDADITRHAAEMHDILSEEHGGHSRYSLAELEERLAVGAELPPEILRLQSIRCGCE